jgi:hypothetical protein
MATFVSTGSNEANLMKIKYGKLIEKQFNMDNVILGRIKKNTAFVGKQIDIPVVQSIGGGVGTGSLPTANTNKISKAILNSPKKLYAVVSIDRETMKASKTDEGSFVRMTKYPVQTAVKSFNRNLTRQILKGDISGSGALITATASGSHSTTKLYVDTTDTFDQALIEAIEVGDLVDLWNASASAYFSTAGTGNEVVDIVTVNDADGYLGTGSYIEFGTAVDEDFAVGDILYIQGSKANEIVGIKGVVSATSGTYKNIAVGRRWKSYQLAAGAAALSTDLLNDLVINVKKQCGESPDLLLSSHHQYIKLLNLLEDAKRYNLPARDKKFKGQISFAGIEFMSADGPIPVIADRFMDADEIFALNTKHIELHQRPSGMEWFNEDGTVFLRETTDSYEARYGGYAELMVNPHFQGRLSGLGR